MSLKYEIIKDELNRFAVVYGWPQHVEKNMTYEKVARIYQEELSRHYTDKTITKAITTAWTKARGFPKVSDFFEGYDGKSETLNDTLPSFEGYEL